MENLAKTFLIGAALIGFLSCCTEAPPATLTTEIASASAVCCAGNCDASEGYCCSDGTCNGNHDELPLQVAKN